MKILYFLIAFLFIYMLWYNSIGNNVPPKEYNFDHIEIKDPDPSMFDEFSEIEESFDPSNYEGTSESITEYVKRFYSIALKEKELFKIPASIKLAQGILESGAGTSNLAIKVNNHFGIKWRDWGEHEDLTRGAYTCNEGRFTIFASAWACWRAHSIVLQAKRYEDLYNVDDYIRWAQGLQHYGYAEDPNYAKKLISIIEREKLYLFDNL